MKPLLRRWRDWRERRALARRAIADALWQRTLARLPFLAQRPDADVVELRRLASLFLDTKEFTGAGGLEVTDAIAVAIAAQACLPVLRLGLAPYRGFVGIVVHPDEVVARREATDDDYEILFALNQAAIELDHLAASVDVNPASEHELYLKLFITNAGGWSRSR